MKKIFSIIILFSPLLILGCPAQTLQVPTWVHSEYDAETFEVDVEDCTIRANQIVTAQGEKANIMLNLMIAREKNKNFNNCMKRRGNKPQSN